MLLASEESILISINHHLFADIKIEVPVRSLDTDTVENMIYWINSEDGVRERERESEGGMERERGKGMEGGRGEGRGRGRKS